MGHWPDVGTGGDLATVTWPRGYLVLELRVGLVAVVVGHWPDVGTGGDLATVTWPRGYLVLELRVGLVAVALGRWPDVGTGMAWPSCRAGHRVCLKLESAG
ncbi:hypothetical protein [Aeromonas sp. Y293-4]|uniref:hypothetical protein n=1 Tax=Aeromonas sp. Y293-4 TaxID=2990504 RepID=UPI0022E97168|nr:hypothetical protein [Aeromonas sp. Y293-4]